jgi:hypothetical protein
VLLTCALAFGHASRSPARSEEIERNALFPRLHAGQTFTYIVQYRTQKNVKTESRVVTPSGPQNVQSDAKWTLSLEILDVRPQGARSVIHARAQFQSVDSAVATQNVLGQKTSPAIGSETPAKRVEFTILPDGRTEAVTGLDGLFPEQREAWQQWLRQFAIAGAFPGGAIKRGRSWKSTEVEQAPSPIARLQWEKQATYVRDEPCAAVPPPSATDGGASGNFQPQACAVVLTRAVLKQKSSPKDTTPGDFKLHGLRTTGTANGTNETISYISLQSGLIVRVTEDAKQFMDVVIAKADGSNQVHYNVDANSHTSILLVDNSSAGFAKP